MRDIKFRGWWRHRDGSAHELIEDINDRPISDLNEPHFIIEQFTGLLDKNGKEIYTSDICLINGVAYHIEYVEEFMTWCPFKAGDFELYQMGRNNHFKYCYESDNLIDGTFHFLSQLESYEIEIIGNIHEDKHLLEQRKGE